uniref:SRCR domain-containing protein n=1 Tax=Oreochromis niloticus TaxID=8128 RepID=A0A669E409_ORENI
MSPDSVRLLNGSSLCSGRLEVKSNQSWSSVCEADFDQQDAEVVCRELGCGPPSALQGALYGEVEAPVWSKEFQCGGHESALLDCRSSGSARNSCSPGKAVGLTCSEPDDVRLVGGANRCAGALEVKLEEWRPVCAFHDSWTLKEAGVFCEHLGCGSAVSIEKANILQTVAWSITPDCVLSTSPLKNCATRKHYSYQILKLTCSDLLVQTNIHASSMDRVFSAQQQGLQVSRGSSFTISCSIQPQYPGGSFQLTFTSSNTTYSCTQPAVSHSALFLFPAAEPAHQGNYSCVYHVYVFSHNFFSESHQLSVTVSEPDDVRLVGGASRCAGTLEEKHQGEWRPVSGFDRILDETDEVCERLHCGPFDYGGLIKSSQTSVWQIRPVQAGSALTECSTSEKTLFILNLTCSDPTDPEAHNVTAVVLLVIVLFMIAALCFYCKTSRGQKPSAPDSTELVYYNFSVCSAEGGPTKEEGAQGAEEDLHGDHLTSR